MEIDLDKIFYSSKYVDVALHQVSGHELWGAHDNADTIPERAPGGHSKLSRLDAVKV